MIAERMLIDDLELLTYLSLNGIKMRADTSNPKRVRFMVEKTDNVSDLISEFFANEPTDKYGVRDILDAYRHMRNLILSSKY